MGVARILSGVHFLVKKVDDFFRRRPQKTLRSKYISKSNPPSKNCPKIDSCSGWGALRVLRVHLHTFPLNSAWKMSFSALGGSGQVHPLHPLATAMVSINCMRFPVSVLSRTVFQLPLSSGQIIPFERRGCLCLMHSFISSDLCEYRH